MRGHRPADRRRAGGAQRCLGRARRGGHGQDGAAGVRDSAGVRVSCCARRGRAGRDGARVRRAAPAVRADARPARADPGSPARRATHDLRTERGSGPGSLPRRSGGVEPLVRRGRPAAAGVRDRRCALARSNLGAGAGVRGAAPPGRVGGDRLRRARAQRSPGAGRAARSRGARPARRRCSRTPGRRHHGAAGRAGARSDRGRDARQSAGSAGAAARVDPRARRAGSDCPTHRRCRGGSRRASGGGWTRSRRIHSGSC